MSDVLALACNRRDELRGEIAKLDEFIRTAKHLMERLGSGPVLVEVPDADEPAVAGDAPTVSVVPDLPQPRPWSNLPPLTRHTAEAEDLGGPTRRNLMRR